MSLFLMCVQYFSLRGPGSFSVALQNPKIGTYLGKTSIWKIHAVKILGKWGILRLEKCTVELEKTVLTLVLQMSQPRRALCPWVIGVSSRWAHGPVNMVKLDIVSVESASSEMSSRRL